MAHTHKGPHPFQHNSRQHIEGGGKFESEAQRRLMWAADPRAARKWAHNLPTTKSDWVGAGKAHSSTRRLAAKFNPRKAARRKP